MKSHFQKLFHNVFSDTIEQIMIDLYIAYQETDDGDTQNRAEIEQVMKECLEAIPSVTTTQRIRPLISYLAHGGPTIDIPDAVKWRLKECSRDSFAPRFYQARRPVPESTKLKENET
jgi:hypothetical protein